jgi:hypothetical protein
MDGAKSTPLFCILHELGLIEPDELFDLTDVEVKEVLVEPLKFAGVPNVIYFLLLS